MATGAGDPQSRGFYLLGLELEAFGLEDVPRAYVDAAFCLEAVARNWRVAAAVPRACATRALVAQAVAQHSAHHVPLPRGLFSATQLLEYLRRDAGACGAVWEAVRVLHDDDLHPDVCALAVELDWRALAFLPEHAVTRSLRSLAPDNYVYAAVRADAAFAAALPADLRTPDRLLDLIRVNWRSALFVADAALTPEHLEHAIEMASREHPAARATLRSAESLALLALEAAASAAERDHLVAALPYPRLTRLVRADWRALLYVGDARLNDALLRAAHEAAGSEFRGEDHSQLSLKGFFWLAMMKDPAYFARLPDTIHKSFMVSQLVAHDLRYATAVPDACLTPDMLAAALAAEQIRRGGVDELRRCVRHRHPALWREPPFSDQVAQSFADLVRLDWREYDRVPAPWQAHALVQQARVQTSGTKMAEHLEERRQALRQTLRHQLAFRATFCCTGRSRPFAREALITNQLTRLRALQRDGASYLGSASSTAQFDILRARQTLATLFHDELLEDTERIHAVPEEFLQQRTLVALVRRNWRAVFHLPPAFLANGEIAYEAAAQSWDALDALHPAAVTPAIVRVARTSWERLALLPALYRTPALAALLYHVDERALIFFETSAYAELIADIVARTRYPRAAVRACLLDAVAAHSGAAVRRTPRLLALLPRERRGHIVSSPDSET